MQVPKISIRLSDFDGNLMVNGDDTTYTLPADSYFVI